MRYTTKLVLIGLTLIAIVGLYACVTEAFVITGTAIAVIMLGGFVAGVISGFLIDRFFTTTVHEEGVELGDYIHNVGAEWEADYDNTLIMFNNDHSNLNAMLRYYWSRKAEYIGQAYINMSTFPETTVLKDSGILNEYLNFSRAKGDSLDNLLGSLNDFTESTLVNFGTLDITAYSEDVKCGSYSLKEHQYLTFSHNDTQNDIPTGTTEYAFGRFYYDNLAYSTTAQKNIILSLIQDSCNQQELTGACNVTIWDSNKTLVHSQKVTSPETTNQAQSWVMYVTMTNHNLTDKEPYYINYTMTTPNIYWKVGVYLPHYFTPYRYEDVHDYHVTSEYPIAKSSSTTDFSPLSAQVDRLEWKNSSTIQVTTNFTTITSLKSIIHTLTSRLGQALTSAQSYWSYLRALGYEDINDVPANYVIPTPSMVFLDSDVTEKLTIAQLQALYLAYMRGYADFVTSDTYREVNVTASDINLSDLSLVVNSTAYNSYGNVTYWDEKLAFLMPTANDLTLDTGKNNTMTETVQAYVFADWLAVTGDYYQLQKGAKVYVHEVYQDGEYYNTTKTTIRVKTLGQVATIYDFSILGDPTYVTTTSYGALMTTMIMLMVIMMVVSAFSSRRRK